MPAVQVSPSASLTALFRQQKLLLTAVEDMLASREHQRKDVKEPPDAPPSGLSLDGREHQCCVLEMSLVAMQPTMLRQHGMHHLHKCKP